MFVDGRRLLHSTLLLAVAGLRLKLDASDSAINLSPTPTHARFITVDDRSDLALTVRQGRLRNSDRWQALCTCYPPWQLWSDGAASYIFAAAPRSGFRQHIRVDAGFRSGEVLLEFEGAEDARTPLYPLADLDIVLFANWLASSGELILHASGVEFEGRGYCFVGESGVGKSTMAVAFAAHPGVTLLGEDNLVLRCLDDRFWVFGTPWHLDPGFCSPRGAPLEKLFFLDRTAAPGIYYCSPLNGVGRLLQTAFVPYYRSDLVASVLENLARLAERVPFYLLSHRLGSDVMELVRRA